MNVSGYRGGRTIALQLRNQNERQLHIYLKTLQFPILRVVLQREVRYTLIYSEPILPMLRQNGLHTYCSHPDCGCSSNL